MDSNMQPFILMHVHLRPLHLGAGFYQQLNHQMMTTKSSHGAASATRMPLFAVTPVTETCTASAASGTSMHQNCCSLIVELSRFKFFRPRWLKMKIDDLECIP